MNCHQTTAGNNSCFLIWSEILWIWKKLSRGSWITPADDAREWEAEVCVCVCVCVCVRVRVCVLVCEWVGVFIQIQYGLPFNTSCLFLSFFTMSSKDENNKVAYKKI